jgi:deoxyribonuclease V
MILAIVDAQYTDKAAFGAWLLASSWTVKHPWLTTVDIFPTAADYEPGAFYKRELPVIKGLASGVASKPNVVVIDGYVTLRAGEPGLGWHVHQALKVPVVGVAKTYFPCELAVPVIRGESRRPLYVTAIGMDASEAAEHVRTMHGTHRIPTLIKLADTICREGASRGLEYYQIG